MKKVIVIHQNDIKDCGPCCLQSIIKYYGGYVPIEKIREDTYVGNDGTNVYHLVNTLVNYGFDAIAKKYSNNQLPDLLPAIVHVHYESGLDHFMVLYEKSKDKLILMDPAKGKITLSYKDFYSIFTGIVIEMYPKNEIILMEKGTTIYDLFFNIIKDNKVLCLKLLICSLLITLLTISSGMYFKVMYNLILKNKSSGYLLFVSFLFLIITILKVIFDYYKNDYKNYVNKNIDVKIFDNFINHIFNLPLKVINSHSQGEIISRINEIGSIKEIFSDIFISSIMDVILSIISLVVLFLINYKLAIILLILMTIYIITSVLINPRLYKRVKQNIEYETDFNMNLLENVGMINSIKNLNKVDYALKRIENKLCGLLYDNFDATKEINFYNFIKNNIDELGVFIINTLGFVYVYKGSLPIIDLITFNTIIYYFINPIKNLIVIIPKYNYLKASFHKICDLLDVEKEKIGQVEPFKKGAIKLENVSFSYNDYHKVINNLTIQIGLGEKVMIKGKSGTGKSTFCELLCGKYQNYEGNIFIGNKNILDYSLNTIRKNIIYVGQKESLYSDTIKNNIQLDSDDKNFDKVCKICHIEDIIKKKKFRYDFGIDNNFGNISGGEKQRIVLARALLQEGNIIILDEALSELDYDLESDIIKNIIKEYKDKTLIYVSHKKQEKCFNRIINLKESNDII